MNLTPSITGHPPKKHSRLRSEQLVLAAALTYTIPTFCKLVGISPATGRAMVKANGIPTVTLGKRQRVPDWAVRELTEPAGAKR
jgi:excisionase family DNA binding protein